MARNWIPLVPSGTINADASVAQLEQDVLAMDSKVGELAEDIGATEQEINDLKSEITTNIERYTSLTKNLWTSKWERGALAYNTGAESVDNTCIRTGFMDVKPSTKYTFYDARDWFHEQSNSINYVGQHVFEYTENGTFIKYTTVYSPTFDTSATTKKVRLRSGGGFLDFNLDTINSRPYQLVEGSTVFLESYEKNRELDEPEFPFTGKQSDNLFGGEFNGYINGSTGVNAYITSSVRFSTGLIHAPKATYNDLYFIVYGYFGSYGYSTIVCYGADKVCLGYVSPTTISTSVLGNIMRFTPLANTEYVVLASSDVSGTEENKAAANALKEASKTGLFVTGDINRIYSNYQIDGKNKISGKDTNYGFLEEIRNDNVRDFMIDGLKSYVSGLLETGYDAMIPAMTDIHAWSYEPWAVINYMADSGAADVAVNLGDNIVDHFDTKAEAVSFLRDRFGAMFKYTTKAPMLNAVGNHDTNPVNGSNISDGSKMLHPAEQYTLMRMRNSPGMLSGKCYGYYDLVNAKIRVIILNTSDIYDTDGTPLCAGNNTAIQQDQFDWFCDVALNFSDKDDADEWAVITMAHDKLSVVGGTGNPFATVITAFTGGTTGTASGSRTVNDHTFTLSKSVDYTSQGAVEYIGHICGHYHDDNMTTFATNYKEVEIPCAVLTAHYYEGTTRKDYTRTKNTIEELLFDTVCIDRANKTVLMKRFGGVGSDRTFTYGS